MRKHTFCISLNKSADQEYTITIHLNSAFNYIPPSSIPKSEISCLAIVCACTARFVSDLAGIPDDRFSHDTAHFSGLRVTED